jgi:hypothetical protein
MKIQWRGQAFFSLTFTANPKKRHFDEKSKND